MSQVGWKGISPSVCCRHVLDTLISLAKSFPVHFLPEKVRGGGGGPTAGVGGPGRGGRASSQRGAVPASSSPLAAEPGRDGDFWSVLVRLDCSATGKRTSKAAAPPAEEEGGAGECGQSQSSSFPFDFLCSTKENLEDLFLIPHETCTPLLSFLSTLRLCNYACSVRKTIASAVLI